MPCPKASSASMAPWPSGGPWVCPPRPIPQTRRCARSISGSSSEGSRRDDVEPESEVVHEGQEFADSSGATLHLDVARGKLFVEGRHARDDLIQHRTRQPDGGIGLRRRVPYPVIENTILD